METSMFTKAILLLITLFIALFAMNLQARKINHQHHHQHFHHHHSINTKTKTAEDTMYQPTTVGGAGATAQTPPNFGSFPATTFPFPFFPGVTRPFTSNIPGNLPFGNLPAPTTVPAGTNLPVPRDHPPIAASQPGNLPASTNPPFGTNLPFGFPPIPTGFPRITVSIPGIPAQFIAGIFGDNRNRGP